ncbi:hypothetical protein [Colwellia sp. E2M01]|uniref:hypothetical protein n=1 Tax=Colwellia sp. E2M01 TaxID=2841561 RepID=UPI001C08CA6F|nr:hypothetical protein [Colwellia sp. E2M01]
MFIDTNNMALSVKTKKGELIFILAEDDTDKIIWSCVNGEDLTLSNYLYHA